MQGDFQKCAAFTYSWEGGYVNNPQDPGGITNLGVTINVWAAYSGRPVSAAIMQALTRAQTDPLYHNWYWMPVRGDETPSGIALMNYDFGVNAGVHEAVRELELALGTDPDGMLGPNDMGAITAVTDQGAFLEKLFAQHDAHYRANEKFGIFGKGWENRLNACLTEAKVLAGLPG